MQLIIESKSIIKNNYNYILKDRAVVLIVNSNFCSFNPKCSLDFSWFNFHTGKQENYNNE